jgi:hypothetical protein
VGQRNFLDARPQAAARASDAPRRRYMIARAVRRAAKIIVADGALEEGFQLRAKAQEWARCPARGETYGVTYVAEFYDEIVALDACGDVDKNCKVSPDQVREQLARQHPGRFDLPGVWALQNVLIGLGQKKASGGAAAVLQRGRRGRGGSALPATVCCALDELVAAEPGLRVNVHRSCTRR